MFSSERIVVRREDDVDTVDRKTVGGQGRVPKLVPAFSAPAGIVRMPVFLR